jgi:hypothetical protein
VKLLLKRLEFLEVSNLEPWSGIVGGLACCIILVSIDLIVREEGSCNLSRREDPLADLEPIYAFAISAGEATISCRETGRCQTKHEHREQQIHIAEYKASEHPVRTEH